MMTVMFARSRPLRHAGRFLAGAALMLVVSGNVRAQGLSAYRDFAMGSGVAAVAARASVPVTNATTRHERPALLQELEWRPSNWMTGVSTDPVDKIGFSFYNDQLFRIVIDYSRERTSGMTEADMTEALAATYGRAVPKTSRQTGRLAADDERATIARWEDGAHTVILHGPAFYGRSYRLIVSDIRLAELAQLADATAERLDEREAPARELVREKKALEDARDAAEKARDDQRRNFRP